MESRLNKRNFKENVVKHQHLKLEDLKQKARESNLRNQYLFKEDIPESPQPEFHVIHLKHETTEHGLCGIKEDGGFKGPSRDFRDPFEGSVVWWSLAVGLEEIQSAETRLLEKTFPDRRGKQQSFLWKFTTSPAFLETSRLGSYRFTFPLDEILMAYSQQFCSDAPPVLRIYETVLYKQEVMHVVLIHSPDNEEFSEYPLLTDDDPNAVCVFRDGRFIWRPEAMSETHKYQLICRHDIKQMEAEPLSYFPFYVWNHVAIAVHVGSEQVLKFDADRLRQNLKYCPRDQVMYGESSDFENAKKVVKSLWPDFGGPLEVKRSNQQSLTASNIKLVLVGWTGAGKTCSGNIILGRNAFSPISPAASPASGTTQCCLQGGKVFDWMVNIIDTPGLSETLNPELKTEIFSCIESSTPTPYVILLVIRLGPSVAEVGKTVMQVKRIFGYNVRKDTIIVFTHEGQSEPDLESHETEAKSELYDFNFMPARCQALRINPDHDDDRQQVWDLMHEVEQMVVKRSQTH